MHEYGVMFYRKFVIFVIWVQDYQSDVSKQNNKCLFIKILMSLIACLDNDEPAMRCVWIQSDGIIYKPARIWIFLQYI